MLNLNSTHKVSISISLFIIIYVIVQYIKPKWLYNQNGSIRQFGIGYKQKTIVPIWIASIILAILCYVAVYYLSV